MSGSPPRAAEVGTPAQHGRDSNYIEVVTLDGASYATLTSEVLAPLKCNFVFGARDIHHSLSSDCSRPLVGLSRSSDFVRSTGLPHLVHGPT